jgi:lipopolysaccharide export system protein LptA
MKSLTFSWPAQCAFAVLAGALLPMAVQAQRAAAKPSPAPMVAAVQPTPPPAITVGTESDEENEPSPPIDKGNDAGTPETTETEIVATDGATFASKDRIAVFTGNVRVTDPRFQLACDKLTVFLNKSANTDAGAPGATGTPAPANTPAATSTPPPLAKGAAPAAAPSPSPSNSGGIDHAIAEGHVIIVQERAATPGAEAKRSVGRADWANFDNKTGDMVLKGTPSVEQNENTHTATSPDTVMTLRKDNSLTTVGPSRTIIVQRKSAEATAADTGPAGSPRPGQPVARPGQPSPSPGARRAHAVPSSSPGAAGNRG